MADPLGQGFDRAAELLRAVARSRPSQECTAASQTRVDLVVQLGEVARELVEHNRRVLTGDPADWAGLTDLLAAAARACRSQTCRMCGGHRSLTIYSEDTGVERDVTCAACEGSGHPQR